MKFHEKLRILMNTNALKLIALCLETNCNPSEMTSYLSGDKIPPRERLDSIASVFGLHGDTLLDEKADISAWCKINPTLEIFEYKDEDTEKTIEKISVNGRSLKLHVVDRQLMLAMENIDECIKYARGAQKLRLQGVNARIWDVLINIIIPHRYNENKWTPSNN
jgi:hypothetical protein